MTQQHLRRLWRAPAFSLTVLLLVAAAVAANATAFSALYTLAWKPLPYRAGDRLVELRMDLRDIGIQVGLSELLYRAVRADTTTFSGAVGSTDQAPEPADRSGRSWRVQRVTADFAGVLGVDAALGRTFVDADTHDGARAIVLSDRAWRAHLAGDAGVLGRSLRLGKQEYTVIGVMPRAFAYPDTRTDAWVPYVASAAEREQDRHGGFGQFTVAARLAPGASPAQAQASLAALLAHVDAFEGLRNSGADFAADARYWRERFTGSHVRALAILQAAVLLLLAVVAANLANLVVFRVAARRRELAVRSALGARSRDLWLAFLADLLPLLAGGLAAGLALTPFAIAASTSRGLIPATLAVPVGIDTATLLVALATTVVLGAVAVLSALPLLLGSAMPVARLRERTTGATGTRRRAGLIVAQVAVSTALVGGAGLLLRSAQTLAHEDRGFDARGVLLTAVDLGGLRDEGYDDSAIAALAERLRAGIEALPSVRTVAIADSTPFGVSDWIARVRMPDGEHEVRAYAVSPGYFAAMGIALSSGREFTRGDAGAASPIIVDDAFRRRWLGRSVAPAASVRLVTDDERGFRDAPVIAVAPVVKHRALDEQPGLPSIYRLAPDASSSFTVVTRSAADPEALVEPVRNLLRQLAPGALLRLNTPLQRAVESTLADRMALLELVAVFALLGVLLAALGLCSAIGIDVRGRTTELGVRMALGASPARVQRMVVARGGALVGLGVVLGLVLGVPLARLLSAQLYLLQSHDPATWAAAAGVVAIVALMAVWSPARWAGQVPPNVALRDA